MDDQTGTLSTLLDEAKNGNLTKVTQFCVNYLQQILKDIAPNAELLVKPKTLFDAPRTTEKNLIMSGGHSVVLGQISATDNFDALERSLIPEVAEKVIVHDGRRKGFGFAASKDGGMKCKFNDVRDMDRYEAITEELDYETDKRIIAGALEHCFNYHLTA